MFSANTKSGTSDLLLSNYLLQLLQNGANSNSALQNFSNKNNLKVLWKTRILKMCPFSKKLFLSLHRFIANF